MNKENNYKKSGIGLVSCTKTKFDVPSIPKELYMKSDLFKKKRRYCELYHRNWYIVSAKYYLLEPDGPIIAPYDKTLKGASKQEKQDWSVVIFKQLKEKDALGDTLVIHAGEDYYEHLILLLEKANVKYIIPTKGMGIGNQKKWYKERLNSLQKV